MTTATQTLGIVDELMAAGHEGFAYPESAVMTPVLSDGTIERNYVRQRLSLSIPSANRSWVAVPTADMHTIRAYATTKEEVQLIEEDGTSRTVVVMDFEAQQRFVGYWDISATLLETADPVIPTYLVTPDGDPLVTPGGDALTVQEPAALPELALWSYALETIATTPAGIACLGDSVTAGTGASPSSNRWTDVLQASLTSAYGAGAIQVRTSGTGGAEASDFTDPSAYWRGSNPPPRLVIIEFGINDWAADVAPATYRANIENIIADIRAVPTIPPSFLLLAAYDCGTGPFDHLWSEYVDELETIAAGDEHATVLDLRPIFGPPTTTLLDPDLVHPNNTGHALIASTIFDLIT